MFIWFSNKKSAKLLSVTLAAITSACLLIAGFFWVREFIKMKSYDKVSAVVTTFDTSNSKNVWTELTYNYNGKNYTIVLDGHSYWMKIDARINMMVNPNAPEDAFVLYDSPYILAQITLAVSALFAAFTAISFINFLLLVKKEKRNLKP